MPFTLTILGTILLHAWVFEPRGVPVALPGIVVLATALLSAIRSGEWGLSPRALLPASRAAALFTIPAILVMLAAGLASGTLHPRGEPLDDLAFLLPWGGAQQWLLQTVVLREGRRHLPTGASVLASALLFSLVHLPNPFLMLVTFAGALGWCAIYTRHPNVVPLGVSHALGTLAILYAFDDDVTGRLRIGQTYLALRSN